MSANFVLPVCRGEPTAAQVLISPFGLARILKRRWKRLSVACLAGWACVATPFPMHAQATNEVPGLVSLWAGDDNASDSVGSHHGSLQGDVGFRPGKAGSAFFFNGKGGYVQVPDDPELQLLQESTLMAWISLDRLPSQVGRFMYIAGRSSAGNDYDLEVETDDRVRFYPCGGTGSGGYPGSVSTLRTGVWYHVAATYKANDRMELFVNGQAEVSVPLACALQSQAAPLTIGWSPVWGRAFSGRMDLVRLYNRALSADAIASVYRAEAGLIGSPVLRVRTSQVELCWETEVGASYRLEFSTFLNPNTWYPVSSEVIQGRGGTYCTNDFILPDSERKYYRLVMTNQSTGL